MATTPKLAFPYPVPTDSPDGPAQIQALAVAVENELIKRTPVGTVRMSIKATPDVGWLVCNGTARLKADYPELDAILSAAGYPYGSDATHFNLPDMRGRQPVGVGTHADVATLGLDDGLTVANRTPKHVHAPGTYAAAGHTHGPGTLGVEAHDHDAGTLLAQNHHHGPGTLTTAGHTHGAGTLAAAAHAHGPGTFKAAAHAHAAGTIAATPHTHDVGTMAVASHVHGNGTLAVASHSHGAGTFASDGSHAHAIPYVNTSGPNLTKHFGAGSGADQVVNIQDHIHAWGGMNTGNATSADQVIGTSAATAPDVNGVTDTVAPALSGATAATGANTVGNTADTNPAVEGASANTSPSVNGITASATAAIATGVSADSTAAIAGKTATDAPKVTSGLSASSTPAVTGSSALASAGYLTIYFQIKAS